MIARFLFCKFGSRQEVAVHVRKEEVGDLRCFLHTGRSRLTCVRWTCLKRSVGLPADCFPRSLVAAGAGPGADGRRRAGDATKSCARRAGFRLQICTAPLVADLWSGQAGRDREELGAAHASAARSAQAAKAAADGDLARRDTGAIRRVRSSQQPRTGAAAQHRGTKPGGRLRLARAQL